MVRNFIVLFSLMIVSFNASGQGKIKKVAEEDYQNNNYESAFQNFKTFIDNKESKNKKAKPDIYFKGGISAYNCNNFEICISYLEQAKSLQYKSPDLIYYLAKSYKKIDNLSKELTALETFLELHPNDARSTELNIRIFEVYGESENWESGLNTWETLPDSTKNSLEILEYYLLMNSHTGNANESDKLANQIIKINPNSITALEYLGKNSFDKAESQYLKEMKAYKKNRTNKQYNILLKALKIVSVDYRKARDYYLKLYIIETKPEYADYLSKIYERLDDKKKSAYYAKKANQ